MEAETEKKVSRDAHDAQTVEHARRKSSFAGIENLSTAFENPLARFTKEELMSNVDDFCKTHNLTDFTDDFRHGALIAQNPNSVHDLPNLSPDDRSTLDREHTHRWSQPFTLYWLCVMCSLAAAVQGMDETVNNGAQELYLRHFRIKTENGEPAIFDEQQAPLITGLIVGAPYLCCAVIGCWVTEPVNRLIGRRGTIFVSCLIAAVASIWEGVANTWVNLFIARFVLGFGIGPKSSTVPVYAAECAPAPIRGALVMQWQMWTAFGIMLGNIMGVAFGPSTGISEDLGWRLMLGSTVVLPLIVCAQVYFCPESPRWYIKHGKVEKAFRSFQRLRFSNVQAARDTYYTYVGVELEREANKGKNLFTQFVELFTVPRNRRATLASWIVMFGQQFCGVNIIAYYSTNIFLDSGFDINAALLVSMGTGILNFFFAIPALFTIDRWGRRNLLLFTFPFLSLTLLWTGMSFFITSKIPRVAMVTTGMYLFEIFYSPGEGPVPFTYSAEAFPVHVRDVGMSWATATTWCFNFLISFTWDKLKAAFTPQGAFGWYAAWCAILWFLILFFVPETKALTLEELDQVFSVSTRKHMSYQIKNAIWHFRVWVLRQKLEPLPPLYKHAEKLNES
ncbi:sugar porter (SP) family MFS transporter [Pochonia chlamydosporia 170]|uniref:Sugar porter (SP) family MFS transporter n=1 Tax=Pochonia chlamydosporia 170 TaxID=1380566 RepID=A0A179FPW4_METCM|nr:sugar porter (SP) family MFS transporter [Pochonia chlamydosporia 170]OAQ67318.1 sugar porter (SP) family MFS transporter [Pochonia chlamydosporia 170]